MVAANKATCNFVLSYCFSLLSSARTFHFWDMLGFLLFWSFVKSYPVLMIQHDKNKTKQKNPGFAYFFKKLLLSATLISNRSAPSIRRISSRDRCLQTQLCYTALIPSKFGKQNADITNHHNKFSFLWAIPFLIRCSELSFNLEYSQYI